MAIPGSNRFALALFARLREQRGNLFFSPHSLRVALAMTWAGARGETAAQMREALQFQSSDEQVHLAFAQLARRLNTAGAGDVALAVANSLWGQSGAPLLPEYVDLIARHYDGALNLVDFHHAAEAARVRINAWVEEKTRQKIRDLIPSGGLNADTRLVLANAIYFKGMWQLPFDVTETLDAPFLLEDGRSVPAPLMHQKEKLPYAEDADWQAVDLVYRGGALSMLVLLPRRKDGLEALERALSTRMLHDCVARMDTREVKLFLPRFKVTWGSFAMGAELAALGMPLAFNRSAADFSGINGRTPPAEDALFVSAVSHKAVVEVNEEGTEAAAATVFSMVLSKSLRPPPPVPTFRADHPFLFAIRDRLSGVILFLGRVADPTAES